MPYRFREARLQAGLTTVQLAQKMGLTQAAVSQWESGKKVPGIETICRLADLYGVTVDYLCGTDLPKTSESDAKRLLFGDDFIVTDKVWNELKQYAEFLKNREKS